MNRRIAALRPVWDAMLALLVLFVVVDVALAVVPGLPDLDVPGGLWVAGGLVLLFVALTKVVEQRVATFKEQELANTAWAFAKAVRSDELFFVVLA